MNKVIIMGRLTKDPEIRYTTGEKQTAVAKWSVAVDRRFRKDGEKEADFFDCTAFGKTAEHLEKYWHKGMKMLLTGRLEQNQWRDREGNQRSSVGITVEDVEFTERRDAEPPKDKPDEEFPFVF